MSRHPQGESKIANDKQGNSVSFLRGRGIRIVALLLLFGISIGVRSVGVLDRVFTDEGVVLQSVDPWVHLRRVQALTRDFNQDLTSDPYLLFPYRTSVPVGPLFDSIAATIVRAIHGSEATDDQIATVCAWMPPIIAGLTVIAVYLLAARLASPRAGLVAAALVAIGPGLFFYNSRLGAADHHVLEVFLSTLYALFLILALHPGRDSREDSSARITPIVWSILTGVMLSLYLWTWIGGVYWVGIIAVWIVIQFVLRHWRGETTNRIVSSVLPGLLLATVLLAIVPFQYPLRNLQLTATAATLALVIIMAVISWFIRRHKLSRLWFPATILAILVTGGIVAAIIRPDMADRVRWLLSRLQPGESARTIEEVTPLFVEDGSFSLRPAWELFETGLPLAIIGLVMIARRAIRTGHAGYTFLGIWTLTGLICMAGQNRFGYYVAINVAFLVGILWDRIASAWDSRVADSKAKPRTNRRRGITRRTPRDRDQAMSPNRRWPGVAIPIIALAVVFGPSLYSLPGRAQVFDGPTAGWVSALTWMRRNTPEPFGEASAYDYPDRAPDLNDSGIDPYGVMSAWDNGYWITTIARRIPLANPTQSGAGLTGRFFTETNPSEAARMMEEAGARYVALDSSAVAQPGSRAGDVGSAFPAMVAWSERNRSRYYEFFLIQNEFGVAYRLPFYYPDYFAGVASRLYTFGARAVPATNAMVLLFDLVEGESGEPIKRVQATAPCGSETDCLAKLNAPAPYQTVLVSDHPFQSCVALDALSDFQNVFDTRWLEVFADQSARPEVRVFEFMPNKSRRD